MEGTFGKKEKRRYPRFLVDLPVEYRVEGEACLKGGLAVNASEGGLLIESVKLIPLGTRLNGSVFFPKGFELSDLKLAAEIAWKEPLLKEEWEGYQYGLSFVRLLDEDHWKLKMVLTGRFSLDGIDTFFEEKKEVREVSRDGLQIPGYKILVVDDEEDIRKLLVRYLSQKGYRCLQAVNGADALNKAMTNGIDAMITDIAMPEMNGIILTKELLTRIPRLPIMIMTGQDNEFSLLTAMVAGAREYIKKPFSLAEFVIRFDKMMNDQQMQWQKANGYQKWMR